MNRSAFSIRARDLERFVAAGEEGGEGASVEGPDDAGDGVEHEEEGEGDDDDGEVVGGVEGADEDAFDAGGDDG